MNKKERKEKLQHLNCLKSTVFIFECTIFLQKRNKTLGYAKDIDRLTCLIAKMKNDINAIEDLLIKDDERLLKLKQKKYSDITSKLNDTLTFLSKIKDKEMKEFAHSKIDDIIYKMNN